MSTDEDGGLGRVGDSRAQLQRNKDVAVARHFHVQSLGFEERLDVARDIEREILFAAVAADRAFVVAAVAGVEHDGFEMAEIWDLLRTQLRFESLGEIEARDEILPA